MKIQKIVYNHLQSRHGREIWSKEHLQLSWNQKSYKYFNQYFS